ncbi:hypothetical protein ACNKHO_09210 [Shigella flexneri]
MEAAKRFGFSAQNVRISARSCMKRTSLITYPRSDSPLSAGRTLRRAPLGDECHWRPCAGSPPTASGDPDTHNRCWDDKKVDAHHAMIPTARGQRQPDRQRSEGL